MLTGITLGVVLVLVAWAASAWRSKDPEKRDGQVPPAFQYFGWALGIFVLVALIISIFLSVTNT
jgi:Mg/Co/Ni transporter MgtE